MSGGGSSNLTDEFDEVANEALEVDVETADSDCDTQGFILLEELLFFMDGHQNCVQNCSYI